VAEILRVGSTGPAVRVLQHRLNRAIRLPSIKEDGVFGRLTEARTKAFQEKYGLRPDGIAGPATQATLAANFVPDDAKTKRAIVIATWQQTMRHS
jgi:peptidoglycan hydrolase-like protein with peptidoglycan-binding domain